MADDKVAELTPRWGIQAVDFLTALKDEDRIEEARQLFVENGERHGATGFEVWDGARFIYRYPTSVKG